MDFTTSSIRMANKPDASSFSISLALDAAETIHLGSTEKPSAEKEIKIADVWSLPLLSERRLKISKFSAAR